MANQIIQSIKTIAQSLVDNAGYDKTRGGFIVGVNSVTNTYSVKIDGVTYPIVRAVDDATYNIGDVVKVVIPCNQATQMYISSSVLSDDSTGNKIANAVGLAQEAKQFSEDNSLIARKNARVEEGSLILTNDTVTTDVADLLNYLQLNPDSIIIYGDGKNIVTIAKTSDNSGYMEMNGTSLFIAQESRLSTIRLRSAGEERVGKLAFVTGSDGHVSLREVLD